MSTAWTVRVNGRGTTLVEDANGCAIAESFAPRNGASAMETAQLIAAAPDLLAALRATAAALEDSTNLTTEHFFEVREQYRAAIAKAVQS